MVKLNSEQISFLHDELGIDEVDYSNKDEMEEIRMKCFDIETDETMEHLEDLNIGERGNMAVSIIDKLYDIIQSIG